MLIDILPGPSRASASRPATTLIGGPAEATPPPTKKLLVVLPTDDEQEAATTAAEKTKGQCPELEVVPVKRSVGRHVLSLRFPRWIQVCTY